MTLLACVSNEMQDEPRSTRPRRCTHRGSHLESCEDPEQCWGCFPREATAGVLCAHCFEKAEDTISRVGAMIVHLRSVESGGQALGERVATSMQLRLPVPQSWVSADEMLVALGGRPIPSTASIDDTAAIVADVVAGWADVRARVSTVDGARAAVRVTLLLQTALARWPEAEAEYRSMPRPYHCLNPECQARALYRKAPLEYLGDLVCVCEACGTEHDWWDFVERTKPMIRAVEAAQKAEARRERAQKRRAS